MRFALKSLFLLLMAVPLCHAEVKLPAFRPPAVPLVAHDPYFSIWSFTDQLNASETAHWTRTIMPLHSLVRIDGKPYRLMGAKPSDVPALTQKKVTVLPTRTIYEFATDDVAITLTFLTPALPSDLDVLSRPLTYLNWEATSLDDDKHLVEVYFDCAPEVAVNAMNQAVQVSPVEVPGLQAMRVGTTNQPVLEKKGDRLRIDWGYAYVGIHPSPATQMRALNGDEARAKFAADGRLPFLESNTAAKSPAQGAPAIAAVFALGRLGPLSHGRCQVLLAYDDEYSIRYFDQDLRPYWRRQGMDAAQLLERAAAEYPGLRKRCERFDDEFIRDMRRVGGDEYALITALAYRQTLAGCKLVADADGAPLLFPKENSSNGCIGTVDVIYPMMPFCYLFSPALAKAVLVPVLDYAGSSRWTFPFAPHDLGYYPQATGQVYGGGELSAEGQMPVEESADMILLLAGVARDETKTALVDRYWPLLEQWADYLKDVGVKPGQQLCTDDFTGPLASNVNLSAKSICALAAFAQLCEKRGDTNIAQQWRQTALDWRDQWLKEAHEDGHFLLAFDQPGTWSQKYNLVWDRLLGLDLFPASMLREEMDFYLKQQLPYGLPLDSRDTFTKLDWIFWTASLTGDRSDLEQLIRPVFKCLNETPDRVPMSDWYQADTGRQKGFQARPVVGGVFMPALLDKKVAEQWNARGEDYVRGWAPIPIKAPRTVEQNASESGHKADKE